MRTIHTILGIFILGVFGAMPTKAQELTPIQIAAASAPSNPGGAPELATGNIEIRLLVGRSTLIDVGTPISRVSLTSADIADALVTGSTQLLVHGKVPGAISMFVWDRDGAITRYEIAVQRDLARLDDQMRELFPREPIQVHSTGRQIVLSGTVSSQEVVEKAMSVAAGYVEKRDEVVSLLQVQQASTQQVLLRVRFAEVSRSALTELGASFFTSPTGVRNNIGRTATQQFSAPTFSELEWTKASEEFGSRVTSASGKIDFSDFLNLFFFNQRYDLGVVVRALQQRGLFQSLAEPNLVAESGKEASFLAGGEFPIPVAQGSGANLAISVQFKEFGIRLNFTPTVVGDRVQLKVRPEVSTLDFGNAVTLSGFRIPALITRRTETELELRNGQTFAIAGLMNNQMQSTMSKIPGVGDIPILGYLFRSKAAQKEQTELVVMITPEILPDSSPGVTPALPRYPERFLDPVPDDRSHAAPPPAFMQSRAVDDLVPGLTAEQREAVERAFEAYERALQEDRAQGTAAGVGEGPQAHDPSAILPRQWTGNGPVSPSDQWTPAGVPPPVAETRFADASSVGTARPLTAKELQEEARRQKQEEARLEKLAREQAKRDKAAADRARKEAERARKEEAKRAEAERKRLEKLAREQAKRDAEAAKRQSSPETNTTEVERERAGQQALADAEARLRLAEAAYQAELARQGVQ
jgi:pilus assembly protein CpaC